MSADRARRRARRGFSLVELIITLVLAAIIGAAAGRLLMSQTRFYARLANQKDARSVTRAARNIMQTELSMVEASGGIVAASNDSIRVRMPIAWGIFCSNSTIMLLPVDSAMRAMGTYEGYAAKDTTSTGTYTYTSASSAPTTGTATNCTAAPVNITAPTNGSYVSLSPTLTATAGAPVFLYQTVTYLFRGSAIVPGKRGLYRRIGSGSAEEILAPFDTSAKFRFYRLYSDTAQTTVPTLTNIRGLEVMLDAQSAARAGGQSSPESVSIKTAIFFRNRVD